MIAQSSLFSHRFHRRQVGIDTTMEANNSVFVMVNLELFGRSSAISHRDQPAGHKISSTVHNHKGLCNMKKQTPETPEKRLLASTRRE